MKYVKSTTGQIHITGNLEFWKDCEVLTQKEGKAAYYEQAKKGLLRLLKPGMTVYTVLKHVSSSGTSRRISLLIGNGTEITKLDYLAAIVLESKVSAKGGIITNGCGMDMGFELVYRLGRILGEHWHYERDDSGYALRQEWI